MSITINVHDDNNTLKVPSIAPMDGRMVSRERVASDSCFEGNTKCTRSAVSTPTPSLRDIRDHPTFMRPVSDQNLNINYKNRREKAVSWHSKIPTSTQTLGCVEGEDESDMRDNNHTQSQPLLGTLESKTSKKHICRHTYSVKHVRSKEKDSSRPWSVRRCASSGNEKSRFRERYLQLRPTNKVEDYSVSVSNKKEKDKLVKQRSISKTDSMDNSKSDELSLIDWEEDEKLCDEEVGNITGHAEEDDDEITPTVDHSKNSSDSNLNASDSRTPVYERSLLEDSVQNHSIGNSSVENVACNEKQSCDRLETKCDDTKSAAKDVTSASNKSLPDYCSALPHSQSQPDSNFQLLVPPVEHQRTHSNELGRQLQSGQCSLSVSGQVDTRQSLSSAPRPFLNPELRSPIPPSPHPVLKHEQHSTIPSSPRPPMRQERVNTLQSNSHIGESHL